MIKVLVVDDHVMVRTGLVALFRSADGIEVVGEAGDGEEAVAQALALEPDVVLMDLAMPGVSGVEATRRLKAERPDIHVVMLTTFATPPQIGAALDAGANGYLVKDVAPSELISGVRAVVDGGAPLSPNVAAAVLANRNARPLPKLSDREKQVLLLLVEGRSNKQIARDLGISEKTVKTHFGRIFQRIGVQDRTQAALWATKHVLDRENAAV